MGYKHYQAFALLLKPDRSYNDQLDQLDKSDQSDLTGRNGRNGMVVDMLFLGPYIWVT